MQAIDYCGPGGPYKNIIHRHSGKQEEVVMCSSRPDKTATEITEKEKHHWSASISRVSIENVWKWMRNITGLSWVSNLTVEGMGTEL